MDSIVHGYAVYKYHISEHPRQQNNSADVNGHAELGKLITNAGIESAAENETRKLASFSCRLSLLSSNIQAEPEACLRSFLTKRLGKIQPSEGNSSISAIPAGKMYDKNAMVYYYLMSEDVSNSEEDNATRGDSDNLFLICFIAILEMGLELFHLELDKYCQSLGPYLHKYMESVDVSEYLRHLEAWYEINICFIQRCFTYLDNRISSVIFASFLGEEISHRNLPETVSRDIECFVSCCSLSDLLQDKNLKNTDSNISPTRSLTRTLSTKASVEIFFENNEYKIKNAESNPFCEDCVKSLKQFGLENPFKLRQVIETYKLKVIQDMNTFKRLLKQAETNYYALFRSYSFLISSDNGDILLKNAEVQCEDGSDKGSKNVLDILQKYIEGKQGFSSIRNDDKSYLKTQYLLRLLNN